ncbi:MAG: amidohydrolase family protein [Acidobacteria bacterium]|nr:amidohydrolase family protein [Acidobacteriota bacterium]
MLCIMVLFFFLGPPPSARGQQGAELERKLERLKAYPDQIVFNAKIYTMDARLSQAQAMAVRSNRILALGTNAEIRDLAGPQTERLDAKGRAVLPGLVDSHTHPNLWGGEHWLGAEGEATAQRYNDPELKMALATGNSQTEILRSLERVIQQRARVLGPDKWIVVKVFGGNSIPESRRIASPMFSSLGNAGPIDTELLDTLAPDNPVVLFATEGIGPTASNSKAKEQMRALLGYEAEGIFARTVVPWEILLGKKLETAADILKREILECLSAQGITSFGDRFDRSPSIVKVYNRLYQRGELAVRYGYFPEGGANTVEKYKALDLAPFIIHFLNKEMGDFRGIGNDYLWNAGIANEGWEGGLICTNAKPLPSVAAQESTGRSLADGLRPDCSRAIPYEEKSGYRAVQAGLEEGLRIGFLHGYSDGTYDAFFHMVEQAIAEKKVTLDAVRALRIGFEHNPIIRPDQVPLFAKYNIRPAFNGYQVQGEIKGGAFLKTYGEQYMSWMVPLKSLVNAGVHVVFNTDAHLGKNIPVQWKDMDYPPQWDGNIWAFMEFFATRVMPHEGITYNKQEALDKVTLMKAATIWSAEQLLNEKNIGSLEVGKLADFIILNKDFFAVADDQIHTVKPLLTAVGGRIVFQASEY